MIAPRRKSRQIRVGRVPVGGDAPVTVQSMTTTDTRNLEDTLQQVRTLQATGADIVRVAVPDMDAAKCLGAIKQGSGVPIVADIHFDYRLALEAVRQGVDCIRYNPGNIGAKQRVRALVAACADRRIPIRIGINGGSIEKDLLAKHGGPTANALCESALRHVAILEDADYRPSLQRAGRRKVSCPRGAKEGSRTPTGVSPQELLSAERGELDV